MIGMQGNFNQNSMMPNIIPTNNLEEMADQQDMTTEILNISKIKEGFYIGDKISAISLDVIIQFKITHIINATGNQIINQWESIGVSYLTLNWTEVPNQILFDKADEIANKIVEFIDNSYLGMGEGLLAHSFRGQDRVCIVALIYLMKKYKWSLNKSMEYLKSKKQDIDIPEYFFVQLQNFESRLKNRRELTRDIPWEFGNLIDSEEKLLRNTYMNGLKPKIINNINKFKDNKRHIIWADINNFQKMPTEVVNSNDDLFFKKDIKPITAHQSLKPIKGCIKGGNNNISYGIRKNNIGINEGNNNLSNRNNYKMANKNEEYKNILENKNINENRNAYINNIYCQKDENNLRDNNIKNNNFINKSVNNNFYNNHQEFNDINLIATGKYATTINKANNNTNINNNISNNINPKQNNYILNNFNNPKINNMNNNISNSMNNKLNNNNQSINIPNNINRFNQYQSIMENNKRNDKKEQPIENNLNRDRKNETQLSYNFDNNINNKRQNNINNNINEEKNNLSIINNNMRINNSVNIPKSSYNINSLNSLNPNNIQSYNNELKNSEFKDNNYQVNNSIKINNNNNQMNINKGTFEEQNKYQNIEFIKNNRNKNFISAEFNNKNNNRQMVEIPNLNNSGQNFTNNSYNISSQNKIMNNTFNFNNNNNNKIFKASDYSNNNLNNKNNFINYTPLIQERTGNIPPNNKNKFEEQNNKYSNYNQQNKYNNERISNSNLGGPNNFNITRQSKNIYRNNNNAIMNNKPLNNFNPSLIRRKGTPQTSVSSFLKKNEKGGPIKITNNKSESINKKPTTPILNHYNNTGFIDSNQNKNKFKYHTNVNNKSKEIKNNTMLNGFGYSNNFNRKMGIQRPSTAPHKDKDKGNLNNQYKINSGNMKQSKLNNIDRNIKFNKRPSSAGGKSKNEYMNNYNSGMNRNMNKQNINNNIVRKNNENGFNKRLASPQITFSSSMGFNNNNMKSKYNPSKYRIPSPVVKSKNYKRPPLPNRGPKNYGNKHDKFN